MRKFLLIAVFGASVAFGSGCGSVSLMQDGALTLQLQPEEFDLFAVGKKMATQDILNRFDAVEAQAADGSDPNARSGANCAGGVCTIF